MPELATLLRPALLGLAAMGALATITWVISSLRHNVAYVDRIWSLLFVSATLVYAQALPATGPRAVVVSAMQGATDALTALAQSAAAGHDWQDAWSALRDKHLTAAYRLDGGDRHALVVWLDTEFSALSALLSRIGEDCAQTSAPLPAHDFAAVQSLGEVWSSRLLQAVA